MRQAADLAGRDHPRRDRRGRCSSSSSPRLQAAGRRGDRARRLRAALLHPAGLLHRPACSTAGASAKQAPPSAAAGLTWTSACSPSGRWRRTPSSCAATAHDRARPRRPRRGGRPAARRHRRRSASKLDAILLTHTHFDHIGAVAPVARATGAPVYCPEIEGPCCRHHELRALARLRAVRVLGRRAHARGRRAARARRASSIDVLFTPGHSPGHVTFAIADGGHGAPVLRRRALPGLGRPHRPARRRLGRRCSRRSRRCWTRFDDDAVVHPGHMGLHDARPRARDEPVPAELVAGVSERLPGAARHVRRAARAGRCAREPRSSAPRGAILEARRLPAHRDADLRGTPSCSRAASASRPTSSRRRCTPSRTPAGAR